MQEPTQALMSVKDPRNTFDLNPNWERNLSCVGNLSWDMYRDRPRNKATNQSWYLTPCSGFEVQKPTQVLKAVIGLGKTFNLNPKWERTLPSVGNFSWNIFKVPPQNKSKYQSWYITPCCGLEVQKHPKVFKSVKGPGNTFEINPKWEGIWSCVINLSWDIYRVRPQKNQQVKVDIWHHAVGLWCRNPPRYLRELKS